MKILYVDDEQMNLILFKAQMAKYFNVCTAISGVEALKILNDENGQFDVIISDLKMPEMNGFEFLEKVKERFPSIPRYVLTAYFENDKIKSSMESGLIKKCFEKPLETQNFVSEMS